LVIGQWVEHKHSVASSVAMTKAAEINLSAVSGNNTRDVNVTYES
jgi:hypothetical protein